MTVTATGRLSSTEPNLQNIPVRRELGGEIRKMFIASPGKTLCDADYSQIELRLLADISGDETMKSAFYPGRISTRLPPRRFSAFPWMRLPPISVAAPKRSTSVSYTASPFSLSQDIGVSVAEAKQYMENYLSKYHGVRDYMKNIVEKAKKDGYVFHSVRPAEESAGAQSLNFNIRSFGERVALNTPIRGTAADVIKSP